jgi:2-polyprenyl-6-hydroxyphenyl methylase/3-demethylubiquinone-9 3-methyltransferase
MRAANVVPEEIERFGRLAADWWNPAGSLAMLHKLNPVRLKYIRGRVDQHWKRGECHPTPLKGKTALDVGCGGGLLAEPLARLGARVTGMDAAPEVIEVAREHAARMDLEIDYRAGDVQALEGEFDLITAMEVIEHVAEPGAFLQALAWRLAPEGLLIMSTPNATGWSKFLMITIGEGFGLIPRGTHQFDKFISPDRMTQLFADAGLKCCDIEGIAWSPISGLHLSNDLRLNYQVSAVRA